jgi:hypothetical protein
LIFLSVPQRIAHIKMFASVRARIEQPDIPNHVYDCATALDPVVVFALAADHEIHFSIFFGTQLIAELPP